MCRRACRTKSSEGRTSTRGGEYRRVRKERAHAEVAERTAHPGWRALRNAGRTLRNAGRALHNAGRTLRNAGRTLHDAGSALRAADRKTRTPGVAEDERCVMQVDAAESR